MEHSSTYTFCKKVIEGGNFTSKQDFQLKLDVFLMGDRIISEEYQELTSLLEAAL